MRITRITDPDGRVTTIKTKSSCGCLTALAFVVVLFGPAAWFGPWAVPAYVGLIALIVALFWAKISQEKKHRRAPQPPPAPAPPAPAP